MGTKTLSWTDAEQKALHWILQNKKAFLRECGKRATYDLIYTTGATTGWQVQLRYMYLNKNPNYASKLLTIGRAIHTEVIPNIPFKEKPQFKDVEYVQFLEKLYKRYWDTIMVRYEKYLIKGTTERHTATKMILELIYRGFISMKDVDSYNAHTWVVFDPYTQMIWPADLKSEDEAQEIVNKFGIVGTIKKQIHSKTDKI